MIQPTLLLERFVCFFLPSMLSELLSVLFCSPVTALSNGPPGMSSTSFLHETHATASRGVDQSDTTGDANTSKVEGLLPLPSPTDSIKNTDVANGTHVHQILKSSNSLTPINSATSSVARFSSSDCVLLPSQNIRSASAVDTIRHEMDSKHTPVEQIVVNTNEGKSASGRIYTLLESISCLHFQKD